MEDGHPIVIDNTSSFFWFRFFLISSVLVYLYHAQFHCADDEEFGGLWEMVKEGMMTSFALFLVSLYNYAHFHTIICDQALYSVLQ